MRIRGLLALTVLTVTLLAAAGIAQAATINVTTTGDPGPSGTTSLRQALAAAASGDTVSVPAGHYRLASGLLSIVQPITLAGAGSSSTVIDGNNAGGVFTVAASGTVTMQDLTVTGGTASATGSNRGGAGVHVTSGNLTLIRDLFANNHFTGSGGSNIGGGAVYNAGGTLTVTNTIFEGNSAVVQAGGTTSENGGGAIYDAAPLTLTGSTLTGNFASISSGTSDNGGGALYEEGTGATVTSTSFTNNALAINVGSTRNGGGAVYDNSFESTYTDDSVTGNSATLTGTTGDDGGGGMYVNAFASTLINLTISDNSLSAPSATGDGGGGAYFDLFAGEVTNATIASNRSNQPGGGLFNDGSVSLKSSIIAANAAPSGAQNCGTGGSAPGTGGNNLEDTTPTQCGLTGTGDLVGVPAGLAPLANNGGPGPTQALIAGSRAIDHIPVAQCTDTNSNPISTDERGVQRGLDGFCDIGAFESAPGDVKLAASASPTSIPLTGRSTITYTVSDSGLAPSTSTTLKLTLPSGLQLVSASPSQGSCSGSTCSLGAVASGSSAHVTVSVSGTRTGTQTLAASASANEQDPTPADNTASTTIAVTPPSVGKLKVKHKHVSFPLNVTASVKLTIERCTGRGRHAKCKKLKIYTVHGKAGANKFKLKPKKLKAGRYKLIALPSVLGQKGTKISIKFRIK